MTKANTWNLLTSSGLNSVSRLSGKTNLVRHARLSGLQGFPSFNCPTQNKHAFQNYVEPMVKKLYMCRIELESMCVESEEGMGDCLLPKERTPMYERTGVWWEQALNGQSE